MSDRSDSSKDGIVLFLDNAIDVPSTDCFLRLARHLKERWNASGHYHHIPTQGVSGLASMQPIAILSSGSASNIGDGSPWHGSLGQYLEEQLKKKVPVLGICFTHQLMAHRWGGIVGPLEKQMYLEGARRVSWKNGKESIWVVSHGYEVSKLPDCLETMASSALIKHEVLQHKTLPYWSTQAHPEASQSFLNILDNRPRVADEALCLVHGLQFIDDFFLAMGMLPKDS